MQTVAIIGGGVIGSGWAARFYWQGWRVQVFDPNPHVAQGVTQHVENAKKSISQIYDHQQQGELVFSNSVSEAVTGADWVQESLPEDVELKTRVLDEISAHLPTAVPLCSSTSGFKPSVLGASLNAPDRFFVCHPFNPVYLLPLVEVVPHPSATEGKIAEVMDTLLGLEMNPLRVRQEIDGHIADRLLEAMWREALWLVHDDIATTEEIDAAIKHGFGLRFAQMGMFETYRLGGGEAGMRHFLAQFGPALAWPWSKLTDVPELNDELIDKIATQVEAQTDGHSVDDLLAERDRKLVLIMRALREVKS